MACSPGGDVCTPGGNPSPHRSKQLKMADVAAMWEERASALEMRALKEQQQRSSGDQRLNDRIEELEVRMRLQAADLALAAEERANLQDVINNLSDQLAAANQQALSAQEAADSALELARQLQVTLSEMAAQSLAGGDSASQRPATEQQLQPQQQCRRHPA